MKAHGGVWNPVTSAWMFTNAGDHANAMCELYRATRPSAAQLETLLEMALDGTGGQAWDFDPGRDETELGIGGIGGRTSVVEVAALTDATAVVMKH